MSGALVSTTVSSKSYGTEKGKGQNSRRTVAGSGKSPWRNADHLRAGNPESLWASTSLWLLDFASSPNSAYCARRGAFLRKGQAVMYRARSPHSQGVEERNTGAGARQLAFKPALLLLLLRLLRAVLLRALGKLLLCKLASSSIHGTAHSTM